MGNKVLKYLSLFAFASFLVFALLLVLAHFLVTPQRVRDAVIPVLERQLQRPVHLVSVDVSLFSGATINQLEILDRDGGGLLLAADRVILRYQFWPLLLQRVVIDEIRLDHPRVNIERYADGRFNFTDLVDGSSAAGSPSSATPSAADPQRIDLLISQCSILRGELLFKDFAFSDVPYRYKLSDFDLKLTDFSLDREFSLALWGQLNGAPIDIEGTLNIQSRALDCDFVLDDLSPVPFQPYYRDYLPGKLNHVLLGGELHVGGSLDKELQLRGTLYAKQLDLLLDATPIQAQQLLCDLDVAYRHGAGQLAVEQVALQYDGVPLRLRGQVSDIRQQPTLDMTLSAERWPLRTVMDRLPSSLKQEATRFSPAGHIDWRCALQGPLSLGRRLVHTSAIELNGVQVSSGGHRVQLDGLLATTGDTLQSENLQLVLGDNVMTFELSSANWRMSQPEFSLLVRAEQLNLSQNAGAADRSEPGVGEFREVGEVGPIHLPFSLHGDLVLNQVSQQGVVITGVRGQFSLRDDVLSFQDVVGRVANGSIRVAGQVDLRQKGLSYRCGVNAQDVQLGQLISQLFPDFEGTTTGTVRFQGDFRGAGTDRLRAQQNLSGQGEFEIIDGEMAGYPLLDQLADFVQLPELRLLRFAEGRGTVKLITGGQVSVDSRFLGRRSRVFPRVQWGLGGELNGALDLLLAPEVVSELDSSAKISRYLSDQQGWGLVPLLLGGRLDRPSFSFNLKAAGAVATQKASERLQRKLEEKLGPEAGKVLSEPGSTLIDSALEGLLGR